MKYTLPVADGYAVPLSWFAAGTAAVHGNLVLLPALGVAARFYQPLAETLAGTGFNVALVEQRGHGDSALRPSWRANFGFREALVLDLPAVLEHVAEKAPGLPVYLMGHSLGGHYAAITAGRLPARVDGVILAACGTPWTRAFRGKIALQLHFLVAVIPFVCNVLGYYPGERIGFGGREARRLMADWRSLARNNVYVAQGLDEDLDAGIATFRGPVLSLRMADDSFAPEAAMDAVTGKFTRARLQKQVLTEQQLGDRADHFRWARKPAAVVAAITKWLDSAP